jgi:hypothetical protein
VLFNSPARLEPENRRKTTRRPTVSPFVLCCNGICFLTVGALFVLADGHGIRTRRVLHLFNWLTRGREHFTAGIRLPRLVDFNFRARTLDKGVLQATNAGPKELMTFMI